MKKEQHLPCPKCSSSDALSVQRNGWQKCFSCGTNFPPEGEAESSEDRTENRPSPFSPISPVSKPYPERGFRKETIERYKVDVGNLESSYEARYPMFTVEGNHVGNKIRSKGKRFSYEGSAKGLGLFGRHSFPPGSAKAITVVEGQDDALAAYQLLGSKYPVVSVHSSSTAVRDVKQDFEYLNSFERIVFCFDNDEQGKKASDAVAQIGFPVGKVKVMTPRRHKDANDYLLSKESDEFVREWWQAPEYRPDGLKFGSDMWEEIINRKESFSTAYPFDGLNEKTFGIRLSELVIITADTGVGKTAVLKSIEHLLLTDKEIVERNYGVGFLHLEETNGDTALGLISIHNGVPYHIPTVVRPEQDIRKAYDELLNNNRVVIYDHFGSNSVDAILDKVRHIVALGCKYIVLDHLSIIVSDQSGDERKQLDEIATKLKTLTMELDIAVIAVIHTNRQGQIRGTAGVEQLANIVLRLRRDKDEDNDWRRNITKLSVEKNRFCGYTGTACYLYYNKNTSRLTELTTEEIATFEAGGQLNDDQIPWQ